MAFELDTNSRSALFELKKINVEYRQTSEL